VKERTNRKDFFYPTHLNRIIFLTQDYNVKVLALFFFFGRLKFLYSRFITRVKISLAEKIKPWCSTKVDGNGNHINGNWGTCEDRVKCPVPPKCELLLIFL